MENDRKIKNRGIFVRITRKEANERIARREKKLERKLTKKEKDKIIQKVARRARIKTARKALVAGISGLAIFGGANTIKALNAGENNDKAIGAEAHIDMGRADFFKKIKVEVEQIAETAKEQGEYKKEIDEITTSQEALNYFKNMYIEEYEKETGDSQLTTADIKILETAQSYVYVLDDGTIVTHGDVPDITEQAITNDGHEYTSKENKNIYEVSLAENGKVIDAGISNDNQMEKVIPGDRYSEMKDYQSILSKMGPITSDVYKLMEAIDNPDKDTSVEKENLLKHVVEYKNNSKSINQNEQDNDAR